MKIFISYRKSDSEWVSFSLYNALKQQFPNAEVFKDFKAIKAGEDYTKAIEKSLRDCNVLLVVINSSWLESKDENGRQRLFKSDDWVCIEITSALKSGKKVIPVLIDQTQMPSEDALPASIRELPKRQAVRLHLSNFEMDVFTLANAINESVGKSNQYADLVRDIATGKVTQKEIEKPETNAAYAIVCICLALLILWLNTDSIPIVLVCLAMAGLGVYAYYLSRKVQPAWLNKKFEEARKYARNVKLIGLITPVAGIILLVIVILLDGLKFMAEGGMDQVKTLMDNMQKDSGATAGGGETAAYSTDVYPDNSSQENLSQVVDANGISVKSGSGSFDYEVFRQTPVYNEPNENSQGAYFVLESTPVRIVEINNPFVKVEFLHSDDQLYVYWVKAADLISKN